jgi:HlyD family secretion protein
MKPTPNAPSPQAAPKDRRLLFGLLAIACFAALAFVFAKSRKSAPELNYFEARRGDFLISVVEGGTIEAVNEVIVRSDFEGTARIIFIVKEGTYVKKGEVVVELDSAQAQDQVNQQQITFEKNQFAVTQAEQQLNIQKSVVDGEELAADLKLKFAQIDLDKFLKGDREQSRRNAEIEITNVVENLKIAEDRLDWTRKLFDKGWETKTKLDQDELSVSQLRLKKEQAMKAQWMLIEFDEKKKQKTLEAAVQEASENLERVKLQGERRLAQYQADVETQRSTLELSAKKLERDRKQLDACKIKAPQDGLVVYAGGGGGGMRFSSESMVEEGAVVRNRQELIKLPDTSEMKLEIKIHEAHINSIHQGQQAFIVLDSMPDKRFEGVVNRVGLVPDTQSRWGNPNLKLYATQILITEKITNVKPGVSARAEIVITNLTDVITVPIQAVTTRKGKQVVFLPGDPPQATPVTVGMYNTKFIEIASGLKPGDRVLLSPPFDNQEKDLGGSILSKGEALPPRSTNSLPSKARDAASARPPGQMPGAGMPSGAPEGANALAPMGRGMGQMPEGAAPNAQAAGGPGGAGPGRQGGGRGIPEELIKQYDKDGDGKLDDTEREAMRAAMRERFGGQGGQGGPRMSREEMMKQYDKNGDGELDETEREAMISAMRAQGGGRQGRGDRQGGQGGPGDSGGGRGDAPQQRGPQDGSRPAARPETNAPANPPTR